jgi:uncharacterized membrane protein YfcA
LIDIEIPILILLFLAGGFAGFVDSIAGGGGIITVPVLLAVGIPPHHALATNKLQSSFGSLTATMNYARKGLMNPKDLFTGVIFSFLGGIAGSVAVQYFSVGFLEKMILVMLLILFIYTAMSPKMGFEQTQHKINHLFFYTLFGLLIGFYDGFFGPGTGSFWTIALVLLLGLDLRQATAQTKLFNLTSNIVSLAVFIYSGLVLWTAGLVMGVGQIIGAYLGSTLVSKREVHFIRIFFLIVVAVTIIKLSLDTIF